MYIKTFSRTAALTVAAMIGAIGQAQAEPLKLAHFVPPTHIVNSAVLEPFAADVASASDGEVTVDIYPGGELGAGPAEQYARVLQGVADIVWGVTGYTSSQFANLMIAEMPGVYEDGHGSEAIYRALDEHLLGEFPGTKPLAIWAAEPNILILRDKEVRSPDDLKGLKIRVSGSISAAIVDGFGGTPVQMSASEGYNALQTGLIDGTLTGAAAVADFKFDEVANVFITGPQLGHVTFFLTMNQTVYDGLSAEGRAAIDESSGLALSQKGEDAWNARANAKLEELRADPAKTVIDLTTEESVPFDQVSLKVRDELIAKLGDAGAATLTAMKGGH